MKIKKYFGPIDNENTMYKIYKMQLKQYLEVNIYH